MRSGSGDGPRTARHPNTTGAVGDGARRGAPTSASRPRRDTRNRNAARFDTLVAATGQLVWIADSDGYAVEDSPGWRVFTGQSKKQFLGDGWRDAIHPDDRERIKRLGAELLASDQTTRESECRLRHTGGGYRAAHLRCAIVRADAGSARELLFVATDFTERMRGNQERLRLLTFMDAITTNLGEGVYSVGLDGRLTFMNPEAERLLGWSETDLLGKDMHALTHFTDAETSDPGQIRCQLLEVMRTGDTYRGAEMFVRRDGTLVPVSVIASPIASNGRVTGSVVAFNDNTARYHLEEELRIAAQAAAARASEHEAVFEAMGDAILVYDREGRFVHANTLAIQGQISLSGQTNFRSLSPQERARHVVVRDERGEPIPAEENPLSRALRGEHLVGSRSLDVNIRTQEHGELWLQVSAAPMRDERGDVTGAVVIYRSMTERRQLEREIAARARELEMFLDSLMDGVTVYSADGTLAYMNAAGRRMLQFDELPDFFSLAPDERGKMLDARDERGQPIQPNDWIWARILRGEREADAPDVDMWVRNLRGDRRVISFNGVPMRDADGVITGALQVYHDVTEQRRLQREVTDRAALLETVFDAMTDGVIVHTTDASIVQHNAAARAILGLPDDVRLLSMSDLARWVQVFDTQGQPLPRERWPITQLLRGERLNAGPDTDLTLR
ncbi:MAG: PAS domain S-box protein, partial [Ktedonobacterales bacterium]